MCIKTFFIGFSMLFIAVFSLMAQPRLEFDRTEHNYGEVIDGSYPKTTFTFKNTGDQPLVLKDVRAGCGCTAPTWTRDSVAPGGTGTIDVVFNTNGYVNRTFAKSVVVTTNYLEGGASKQFVLYINGKVIPKNAGPKPYPFVLSENMVNFGNIQHGKKAVKIFTLENMGDSIIKINKVKLSCDECMIVTYEPESIKPKEKFTFKIEYLGGSHDPRNFVENVQLITNIPDNQSVDISHKGIVVIGEVLGKKQWKEYKKQIKAEKKEKPVK